MGHVSRRRLFALGAILCVLLLALWCGGRFALLPLGVAGGPRTEAECLERLRSFGLTEMEHQASCKVPAPDAGRLCTSSPQCAGYCAPILTAGDYALGQCSRWKVNFGCFWMVQAGRTYFFCTD